MVKTVRRITVNLEEKSEKDLDVVRAAFPDVVSDSAAVRKSIEQYARILRGECGGCEA